MTDYKNELEQILNRLMISANNHRGNAFLLNSDHRKALSSLEALLSKRELEARVDELIYLANHANPMILNRSYIQQRIKTLTNREEK